VEFYGWGKTLRSLSLSRNRIAALELLTNNSGTALLPLLETLDLSHNLLPSTVPSPFSVDAEPIPLLSALATLAPALVSFNLHRNRLTSLAGVSPLLFPSSPSSKGLKSLDLSENKIVDIEELGVVAKSHRFSPSPEKARWRLEELDLSSNEIAKVRPRLFLYPFSCSHPSS
jgi:Leucine-rich repeat (LRR) protein